ncbi:hypothetical protein PO124_05545 [Bacillus licheniformis]|nr:hypothetical protein [Bacillus licheniformis]
MSINVHLRKQRLEKKNILGAIIRKQQTSGALGDLGVHLIDLILYLFDSPFKLDSLKVKMMTVVKEKNKTGIC